MTINKMDVHMIHQNNMPYLTGFMNMQGIATMETELEIIGQYQTKTVEYIIPQEEGFYHHITGNFIDKNQYFIRERTIGELNTYVAQNNAGEKPNMQKETEYAQRRSSQRWYNKGHIERLGV